MRYTNGTEIKTQRELQNELNMSFPANSPPDGWTEYAPPKPDPVYYYSLSPQMPIVEVGADAVVIITGNPDETIALNINGETLDVLLDENGHATETFVPELSGEYVVKNGHGNICVIKAVD
jgi:hypothetical protein